LIFFSYIVFKSSTANAPTPLKLLDQLRAVVRYKHFSLSTEKVYVKWVRDFVRWSGLRHPREMGAQEVEAYWLYLAMQRMVCNQALCKARRETSSEFSSLTRPALIRVASVAATSPVMYTPSKQLASKFAICGLHLRTASFMPLTSW
jgi:hypothetical protein